MPKTSKTTKLETCPYCDKRYSMSHMYKHVKQEHPGMKYSTKGTVPANSATSATSAEQTRDNRLRNLKQEFMDDLITHTEYEKSKGEIEDQYEIDLGTTTATLDVALARTDIKYVQDYLIKHTEFDSLMKKIANGEHTTCFLAIFKGQLQIQESCTGFKICFVDQNKLVSENTDIDGLVKLYRLIIDAMERWIVGKIASATEQFRKDEDFVLAHQGLVLELQDKYLETLYSLGKKSNLLAAITNAVEHLHAPVILPH